MKYSVTINLLNRETAFTQEAAGIRRSDDGKVYELFDETGKWVCRVPVAIFIDAQPLES